MLGEQVVSARARTQQVIVHQHEHSNSTLHTVTYATDLFEAEGSGRRRRRSRNSFEFYLGTGVWTCSKIICGFIASDGCRFAHTHTHTQTRLNVQFYYALCNSQQQQQWSIYKCYQMNWKATGSRCGSPSMQCNGWFLLRSRSHYEIKTKKKTLLYEFIADKCFWLW